MTQIPFNTFVVVNKYKKHRYVYQFFIIQGDIFKKPVINGIRLQNVTEAINNSHSCPSSCLSDQSIRYV